MASRQQYVLEILLGAKTAASYQSSINNVKSGMTSISSHAKKAAGLITAAFAAVNITGAVKDAVNTYSGFEQELANSAAISAASSTEYTKMEKAARDAGKATTKTAEESASALGYMALAGWNVNQSTQSLMPVLKLSEATNLDLAETSDLVTDSMSALKLSVKDLPEYLDLVTAGNNSSNTTSEQLMQAFIKTGGAARTLKMNVKETGTALGILANNGTKAEEGGRTLNAILTRIGSNKNALKQMDALGIKVFDAKGNFVGFEEALKRINTGLSGLSVEDKTKAMKEIAGTQYYSKMAYLLDGVKTGANGAESAWDDLEDKLANSEGSLDKMDEKITDTSQGALKRMESALDDAKISFADAFDGEYVTVLDDLAGAFNDASDSISDFASANEVEIHQAFEEVKDTVITIGTTIGDVASFSIENIDKIEAAIAGVGGGIGVTKAIKGINTVTQKITLLGKFASGASESELEVLAKGIGGMSTKALLAAGVVGVAAGAIIGIGVASYKSHQKMVKADLENHFGNISLSLEDIDDIAQDIVGKKKLTQIATMLDSISKTDDSVQALADNFSNINKVEWKLKAGFEIDKDDTDLYTSSVKDYIKAAQETLDNKGYTVSVATKILLGSGSRIEKENNAFYTGLDAQMNVLKNKLNKKIQKAVENGVDINTDKSIKKLLKKMSKITSTITESENEAELQSLDLKYSGKDLTASNFTQMSKDIKKYEKQASEGADEAYKTSMSALNARKATGDITDKKYNKEAQEIKQGYYDTKSESLTKGAEYLLNSIKGAYPELANSWNSIQSDLSTGLKSALDKGVTGNQLNETIEEVVNSAISKTGVSTTVSEEITKLFESGFGDIWSDMENLQDQMQKQGMSVPKALSEGITDTQSLSAITGSTQDAYILLGKAAGDDEEMSTILSAAEKAGAQLPDGVADGISDNSEKVQVAANDLFNKMKNSLSGKMNFEITTQASAGSLSTSPGKYANSKVETSKEKALNKPAANLISNAASPLLHQNIAGKKSNKKLYKNAKGGIYSSPILTTFAEKGPEAAVPLDGSSRAKSIWQRAGQILGMSEAEDTTDYNTSPKRDQQVYHGLSRAVSSANGSSVASGSIQITYAPVIEVKGNADEKTLTKVVKMSQAEFAKMMNQYQKAHGRVSFNG